MPERINPSGPDCIPLGSIFPFLPALTTVNVCMLLDEIMGSAAGPSQSILGQAPNPRFKLIRREPILFVLRSDRVRSN